MGLLDLFFSPAGPTLRGERVILRLPRGEDYESWRSVRQESRSFLKPWEPHWPDDELTRRAFRRRLSRHLQEAHERSSFTFFLIAPADGKVLGGVTVGQIRRGVAQCCTLGYWMGQAHAGQGLMRAAVELLKPFVFDIEGLHRIEAACLPSNTRSIRLLEKSGFRREGYLKKYLKIDGSWEDHQLYALLAEDWAGMPRNATPSIAMGTAPSSLARVVDPVEP